MTVTKSLETFTGELAQRNLRGQWQAEAMLQRAIAGPTPPGDAFVWRWESVYGALREACTVLPRADAARRNIGFQPTGLGVRGTTHTIACGMQLVLPGEIAWAHRHSLGALRFGIEGSERLYTVVEGEPLVMLPNDLVLTPNWTWHDHHNDGDRPGVWLDVLDVPLVAGSLNQLFFAPLGETTQALRAALGTVVSPMRYAWRDVEPQLAAHASATPPDPCEGIVLPYRNPVTGGATLPTLGCALQLLPAAFSGRAQRTTASAVYHVIRGRGRLIAGESELTWGPRDTFVVQNWSEHRFVNDAIDADALFFRVSDEPVIAALGLLRKRATS